MDETLNSIRRDIHTTRNYRNEAQVGRTLYVLLNPKVYAILRANKDYAQYFYTVGATEIVSGVHQPAIDGAIIVETFAVDTWKVVS